MYIGDECCAYKQCVRMKKTKKMKDQSLHSLPNTPVDGAQVTAATFTLDPQA